MTLEVPTESQLRGAALARQRSRLAPLECLFHPYFYQSDFLTNEPTLFHSCQDGLSPPAHIRAVLQGGVVCSPAMPGPNSPLSGMVRVEGLVHAQLSSRCLSPINPVSYKPCGSLGNSHATCPPAREAVQLSGSRNLPYCRLFIIFKIISLLHGLIEPTRKQEEG